MIEQEAPMITTTEREAKIDAPQDQEEVNPEAKELSKNEVALYSRIAVEAILGKEVPELTSEQTNRYQEFIEQSIQEGVIGLPELLAGQLETVNAETLNSFSDELVKQIKNEADVHKRAELQVELIFQNIALTSRVQNGGSKGFLPSVAREVQGLDCSLSAHILHQKLMSQNISQLRFAFGYPAGHAVGIVTVADGRRLYVDAQNGFVAEVMLARVQDENTPDTAYPIYEILESNKLKGHLPGEGEVTITAKNGSDYIPRFLGVRQDGAMHTLSNMHMLVHPDSPTFYTETGKRFRQNLGMPELSPQAYEAAKAATVRWEQDGVPYEELENYLKQDAADQLPEIGRFMQEWESHYAKFQQLVEKVAGGKYLEETQFYQLHNEHHAEFEDSKKLKEERDKLQTIS